MKLPRIIGIVIVSTMIVSGCSVDWNDEKDKKIAELELRIGVLSNELKLKDIESQKLEFEKMKYEEKKDSEKERYLQERTDTYKIQCQKNRNNFMDKIVKIVNSCETKICQDNVFSNDDLKLPANYVEDCVQKKLEWTWEWDVP